MKKITTTVALALAATSAAHGAIGDNPLQLAARFKTKPIVVEQMTPRTIRVVYVEDGWITVVTLVDGISKAELMARADNGFVGGEGKEGEGVAYRGGGHEGAVLALRREVRDVEARQAVERGLVRLGAARWEAVFRSRQDDPCGRQEIQRADRLGDPSVVGRSS